MSELRNDINGINGWILLKSNKKGTMISELQ